ncbi:MAG: serine/threonine-protein kinase [Bryobacteraceae bacterium]
MDPQRWRRIEEVYHAASVMEAERQEAYVTAECGEDEGLRQEVLSLLRVDDSDSLLQREVGRAAASVVGVKEAVEGERIGSYRVLRPLGRGGMGVVYLAERADDAYHKQVAIKLVRTGLGTDESLRRFRAERQILAKLEHAHIARLLDGGASESGQPYVVMEYVEGKPLLEYCREKQLGLRARLALFQQICGAVQYAHQNLIVHRDIKPGNVLVNNEGVAKLVDFGIAKLLADDPIASTATQSFERLLTPEYASPEQVRGEAISTASDVYSLGALLYELLAGKPPLEFPSRTALDVERVIGEQQPVAPSVRSGNQALAGDLDNITLMALRKEPERRYVSAAALAEDIQRYLDGYPVQARQEGMLYQAAKFVRRNRVGVGGAALFLALLAGFVWTVVRERNTANRERMKAEQVSKFLVKSFELANPSETRGKQVTAREILEQGVSRMDKELQNQPDLQATLMNTIAEVYLSLGLLKDSLTLNARAIEQAKKARRAESVEMADLVSQRSYLLRENGQYKPAKESMQEAFRLLDRVAKDDLARRASYLRSYGPLLYLSGESEEAEKVLREALALRRRLSGDEHEEVVWNLANLSRALTNQKKYDEALKTAEEALQLVLRRNGEVSESTMSAYNRIGVAQYYLRHGEAAAAAFRKAIEIGNKLYGPENKDIASNWNGLGAALELASKWEESAQAHRQAIAIFRKAYGGKHPVLAQSLMTFAGSLHYGGKHEEEATVAQESLEMVIATVGKQDNRYAIANANVARSRADGGDFEGAWKAYEEAYGLRRKKFDTKEETTLGYLVMLSAAARVVGKCGAVEPLLQEAILLNAATKESVQRTQRDEARTLIAACQSDRGQEKEAEPVLREVLAQEADNRMKARLFPVVRYQLGRLLVRTGRAAEAEPLLKAAQEKLRGTTYYSLDRALNDLAYARCLRALGRNDGGLEKEARKTLQPLQRYAVVRTSLNEF